MESVKIWPEWKIEDLIGEGSYGKVYKVQRENQGRVEYAALKVIEIPKNEAEVIELKASGLDDNSIKTYYENAANDLFNEIKIMESLRSAPNVVTLQDARLVKKEEGVGWTIYIRMELLTSMGDYLHGRQLTKDEVMKLGIDISSAISSCEKAHIIHRDIKPQNIFVNEFGDFKLGDFGIAKKLEKTGSVRSMKGTSMYMAPEVAKGQKYDHTVDIYSLGIMLYRYMNHGRAPFYPAYPKAITPIDVDSATQKKNDGETMPAPDEADEEQARIILKACSYYPIQRYQSAESMNRDLQRWRLTHSETDNSEGFDDLDELLRDEIIGTDDHTSDEKTTVLTRNSEKTVSDEKKVSDEKSSVTSVKKHLSGMDSKMVYIPALVLGLILTFVFASGAIRGSRSSGSSDSGVVTAGKPGRDTSVPASDGTSAGTETTSVTLQDNESIWTVEPTLPFESVTDITTFSNGEYSGLSAEQTGYSIAWDSTYTCNAIMAGYNGKVGVYDFYGNNLCPVSLDWMESDTYYEGQQFFAYYEGNYYYMSEDFTTLIPIQIGGKGAEGAFQFYAVQNGIFGSVTGTFEDRYFTPYDISELNITSRAAVNVVDNSCIRIGWTVIDQNGKVLTDTFDGCSVPSVSNSSFVNSMVSFTDTTEERVDELYEYTDGEFRFTGLYGFVNADTGVQITDVIYEDVKGFQDGYAPVKKDGKWAYIDKNGNEVTDFIFDDASMLYSGYAYVRYDGYYGVLNIADLARNAIPVTKETCDKNRTEYNVAEIPQGPPTIAGGNKTIIVKVNKLNIRSGPGTSYQAVGRCNIGDSFSVYDVTSDGKYTWYKIGEGQWVADENGTYVHYHEE